MGRMSPESFASYRAALPPGCFGEPDDEPFRPCPPKCDGCGRFIARGKGRVDHYPDSLTCGPERFVVLCPACVARTPLPPTEAEVREHDRLTLEAYDRAMRETWEQESREVETTRKE